MIRYLIEDMFDETFGYNINGCLDIYENGIYGVVELPRNDFNISSDSDFNWEIQPVITEDKYETPEYTVKGSGLAQLRRAVKAILFLRRRASTEEAIHLVAQEGY